MDNSQRQGQMPGMSYPQCGRFIPTTVSELLTSRDLQCPFCGLRLTIDRAKCSKAMDALAKVEAAQRRVEKTSKFNGRY